MGLRIVAPVAAIIAGLVILAVLKKRLADVGQGLSLIVIFLLGVGVPVVVLVFGDMADLVRDGSSAELFGRLTQTLLIVLAALSRPCCTTSSIGSEHDDPQELPAAVRATDPTIETLYDVDAKYGDLLIEVVGRDGVQRARANRSNPYPLFMAAALITLGWLLVLPVVDDAPGFADPGTISSYLEPRQTTYVFGFLGVYFFVVSDRSPVRAWRPSPEGIRRDHGEDPHGVHPVVGARGRFRAGRLAVRRCVPRRHLAGDVLHARRRGTSGDPGEALQRDAEPHPLTSLEGIDLYDRARLQDEGVNNVEALAHHDLVELMLALGSRCRGWSTGWTKPSCTCTRSTRTARRTA